MYWNRLNLPNRPILSISNLSPRNYDAGLRFVIYIFLKTNYLDSRGLKLNVHIEI